MRYIQKLNIPNFFIEDVKSLQNQILNDSNKKVFWKRYREKQKLKKHLLKNEQNYLCCYCESKIEIYGDEAKDGSHIEHLKPKSLDYDKLTFDYHNLVVSCQGTCHNEDGDSSRSSCGHKKEDEYNEEKFLNPTRVEDIRDYFRYKTIENEKMKILPTDKAPIKAQYMINILHLNAEPLLIARGKALKDFEENQYNMKKEFEIEVTVEKIIEMLLTEDLAFISTLRYEYRNL